jgi:hypothetical protein
MKQKKDITSKLSKFLQITGIINHVLKPSKVQKQTSLKIYNTLALPTLLYGSETWTLREQDKSRITAAEIKFMRKTAKYTRQDHKRNQKIMKELKTNLILEKINSYKEKWIQHVHRMERSKTSTGYPELPTIRENKPETSTEKTIGSVKMRSEQAMRPKSLRAL